MNKTDDFRSEMQHFISRIVSPTTNTDHELGNLNVHLWQAHSEGITKCTPFLSSEMDDITQGIREIRARGEDVAEYCKTLLRQHGMEAELLE